LQADALGDLSTSNNTLSVWYVEEDRSNLEQIITALAATHQSLSNFDYALLEVQVLSGLNIPINPSPGNTPDGEANVSWHRDLIELSAQNLLELAQAIMARGEKARVSEREVRRLIGQAVASGRIERTRLQPRVRDEIDKMIP
jgi:hypothetical protein